MECIICRKNKNDMTDEHVIPDSLGGYYHIYNVCKACNSKLGDSVDNKLVNHHFSNFMRYINNIKGKKSSIPNPFLGTHSLKEVPSRKVQLRLNEEGKTIPYLIPEIKYHENKNGVIEGFEISVDSSDKNKIQGMLDKITKRIGIPKINVNVDNLPIKSISNPTIHGQFSIDLRKFRIGLLKIAYEYAIDSIPEYYFDPQAICISQALCSGDASIISEDCFIGTGLDHSIKKSLEFLLDFSSKKHYLLLINIKDYGLMCFVYLYDTFSIGVKLSNNENYLRYNWLLGVNDIEGKNFKKFTAEDAINQAYSKPELRFQYYFKNKQDADEFCALEKREDFDFYKEGDSVPLYNKDGKLIFSDISEKIKISESMAFRIGDPKKFLINEVSFLHEELYIKILPTNKLLNVVSVCEERCLQNKI